MGKSQYRQKLRWLEGGEQKEEQEVGVQGPECIGAWGPYRALIPTLRREAEGEF